MKAKTDAMEFLPTKFSPVSESKILRVIFNTDLRNNHEGLAAIAKNLRINTATLQPGEYVVFVNSYRSALKFYVAGQIVAHFRMPTHRRMDMRIIAMLPKFFNGRELRYDDALRELIRKEFGK